MGVAPRDRKVLENAIAAVRNRGYEVVIGTCMDGTSHVSAPAPDRAAELITMLTDPSIHAVVPPRGGETAIDLLPLLDWEAIAAAEPTWFVGFSDIATLILPVTMRTGMATLHSNNLMNTPYAAPRPTMTWLDVVARPRGTSFTQAETTGDGQWERLDGGRGAVDITGRLIGGCLETVRHLAGTPYGDAARFCAERAPEGLIVYVEAAGDDAFSVCRSLHGMRLAGFFDRAGAVLIGRTIAPDSPTMTQREAVIDALGGLGVPIIANVGCGHVPPYLPIVNGALGRLRFGAHGPSLAQSLA
jgi:muramoyltetrapeptide carboxypeptidase LdcA involved in peptidoglycan recycling